MDSVRKLYDVWNECRVSTPDGWLRYGTFSEAELDRAIIEDHAAHAAELEAKDRRIAELESEGRFARNKCTEHAGRIAELEAKLVGAAQSIDSLASRVRSSSDALLDEERQTASLVTEMAARIAELEAERDKLSVSLAVERDITQNLRERIREMKAELAKRELPPLPESVREWVERIRSVNDDHLMPSERGLLHFVDTHYPAPVPQWELDARAVERVGAAYPGSDTASVYAAIAARMREREAGRDAK